MVRRALFFISLALVAAGSFTDANGWLGQVQQVAQLLPPLRVAALHVPYFILVAALWLNSRVGPRVSGPTWAFVVLFLAAMAQIWVPLVKPVPLVIAVALLIRLLPREGLLYEAVSFPSIRAFLAFTLLLAMSLRWGGDVFGFNYARAAAPNIPSDVTMVAVCAIVAAAFISIAKLRHRKVHPCGAPMWLAGGLAAWLVGEAAHWAPPTIGMVDKAAVVLQIAGHFALFIGAFLLLANLLPVRDPDLRA